MERSDGSLAPVTYLFGPPPVPGGSFERSIAAVAESMQADIDARRAAGSSTAGSSTAGSSTAEASTAGSSTAEASAAEPHTAEPAWATPGVDFAATAAETPATVEPTRDERRAHNVGLNALTRRGQSVAEMVALLQSRELTDDVVEAEIKRLKSVGLLDDFALAETLVRTLSERKGLGSSAIKSELRQRKIAPVAIDAALEALDGDDEVKRAIEIAVKRAGQLRSYDQATAKRRLGAFLQRRGYSGSVMSAAMAAAFAPGTGSSGSGPRFQ
jgi:regulatory protein